MNQDQKSTENSLASSDSDSNSETDSDCISSNSRVYEAQPVVLDLHGIKTDDPLTIENSPVSTPVTGKKYRKKKKSTVPVKHKSDSRVSSKSLSSSDEDQSATDVKEKFYDARESYHGMPENQGPIIAVARMQTHMETSEKGTPHGISPPSHQTLTQDSYCDSLINKPTKPTLPRE